MSRTCKNCRWWEFVYENCGEFGRCDSPLVDTNIAIDNEGPVALKPGESVVFTTAVFGCIYFTPQHENRTTNIDYD